MASPTKLTSSFMVETWLSIAKAALKGGKGPVEAVKAADEVYAELQNRVLLSKAVHDAQ